MNATQPDPAVSLSLGRVRGRWAGHDGDGSDDGGAPVAVYRGLPYAQAPFGALRFQPPQPVAPWPGERDAGAFGPAAPQAPRQFELDDALVGGPDCLTLNIWTPARPGERLPVMVWIPGGGFMRGSAADPLYDGAGFARQGMVFVSLNYRLGVDGFMQMDGVAPNRGLLDQIAALCWVQAHIENFGGDPSRVCVAGVSAGAGSVACLLASPQADGLFQRAILQSPSVSCQTPAEAAQAAGAIAQQLGVAPTARALAGVPLHQAVRAVARLSTRYALRHAHGMSARNFFAVRPVIDGALLADNPLRQIAPRWARGAPLDILVGANAQEMRFYLVPGGEMERIDDHRLNAFVDAVGLSPGAVAAYAADAGAATPGELLCAIQSDYYYRLPAHRLAQLAAGRAWLYEFAWASPQHGGRLGAAHAVELPFVFGNLGSPQGLEFTGAQPPQALSAHMHAAWAAFVRGGPPGWPAHQGAQPLRMRFDQQPGVEPDDAGARAARWGGAL